MTSDRSLTRLAKDAVKWILRFPSTLILRLQQAPDWKQVEAFLFRMENRRDSYLAVHERPRSFRSGMYNCDRPRALRDQLPGAVTAVVMQGPIMTLDNFTLETCRFYRHLHPNVMIIVSTWVGEDEATIGALEREGVEVVQSTPPSVSGYWNINFQIVSTQSGLAVAKERGATFALKTRTDQRFYAPNMFSYLESLLDVFPLEAREAEHQDERLVVLNIGTCKYRAYAISDMFLFGKLSDVTKFWTQPLDPRTHLKRDFSSMREEILFRAPEIYFLENYLKIHDRSLTFEVEDGWDILARHFVVADAEGLDFCWRKYGLHLEHRYRTYGHPTTAEMVGFSDWLQLYTGRLPEIGGQDVLGKRFGAMLE